LGCCCFLYNPGTRWLLCPCRSRFGVTENVSSYTYIWASSRKSFSLSVRPCRR
jgi:hypothetical protein